VVGVGVFVGVGVAVGVGVDVGSDGTSNVQYETLDQYPLTCAFALIYFLPGYTFLKFHELFSVSTIFPGSAPE